MIKTRNSCLTKKETNGKNKENSCKTSEYLVKYK